MGNSRKTAATLVVGLMGGLLLGAHPAVAVHGGDREVTVGSNDSEFSRNKQNEPAVAIDAAHPNVLAAGANDNIDMELCNAGADNDCPFTPGVGGSGVQFSFDKGDSWIQPTYTGYTARNVPSCIGQPGDDPGCQPEYPGPIGTLPWYYENGLVSDGDPAVAFGPQPGADGEFSWTNGSRLYYANLSSNFSTDKKNQEFKGFEAIYVSRIDGDPALTPAIVQNKRSWMDPVRASKQSSATFADKEQIWADNAASSQFFGNVYMCYAEFRGFGAAPLVVSRSTDGGDTWETDQLTPAHNVSPKQWGQSGCTIRTDSEGVVYVFYEEFQSPFRFRPPRGTHMLVKSFDGGDTWTKPRELYRITDPCFVIDPVIGRCIEDGIAGARNDLAGSPSVDIANGAPSGAGATNMIVNAWSDGRDGLNNEHVMFSYSRDHAETWVPPRVIESSPRDRAYYAAPALSPNGEDVYVVYNAFTTRYRGNTFRPRSLVGVVLHAEVPASGAPHSWQQLHRGEPGDPRASSQNNLEAEFLGDYVYAAATRNYATAVWNDVRNGAVCPAINRWRMRIRTSDPDAEPPAPDLVCPSTFGNTDIYGWSGADPTP
jgi:hypothetical protein